MTGVIASAPPGLRFMAEGASGRIYDLGDSRVLKLFHDDVSDEMIAREAAASIHAAARGVPAAAAIEECVHDGRRGIIYPYLPGRTLMHWLRLHPLRAGQAIDAMAYMQSSMHGCDAGNLRSLVQVLATDIAYGPAHDTTKGLMTRYLNDLPDDHRLAHGDYHLGNIMVAGPSAMTIIDWSKAAGGHPAADLVRSEMLMRFGCGPDDPVTNIFRDWAARRLIAASLRHGHITAADLAAWRPVVAVAWLRARKGVRARSFARYLNRAMAVQGLPPATWDNGL